MPNEEAEVLIPNAQEDGKQKKIAYKLEFTRNPKLINQYKALREKLYGIDKRFVGFRIFDAEDAEYYEDPDDQMLIIHDGINVFGGACLRISTPQKPIILNSEQDVLPQNGNFYYSIKENFPELELDKYAYSEFIRIVVDPQLRKGVVVRELYKLALQRCIDYKVRYMFGIADKGRSRLYQQIYSNAGMNDNMISVAIPMRQEYERIKMYLIGVDMKKKYITPNDPTASCMLNPINDFQFSS